MCISYVCLYFDYKNYFFYLATLFSYFFVVGLFLETYHKFRSLKYANVYVTVPFQSASELSFPSRIFSGVTHIRYFIIAWKYDSSSEVQRTFGHSCSHAVWKGMCGGTGGELCISKYDAHIRCSQCQSLVSRCMSVYISLLLFTTFFFKSRGGKLTSK